MKTILSLFCVLSLFVVAGCQNMTPGQKQTATAIAGAAASLSQFVVDTTLRVVIAKAEGPADASNKADLLDSGAVYLRSLEGATSGVLTPEQISTGLTQFTDPSKTHWNVLAEQLATQIMASPQPADVKLEQAAASLNLVASITRVDAKSSAVNP